MDAASASTKEKKVESGMRMDGFTSTLNAYATSLADTNHALEQAQARKEELQSVLDEKRQCMAKLRAQVDAHRVLEQVREEQERADLQSIQRLNKDLEDAKKQLEETKAQSEKLQQLRRQKVSEFEAVMRELSLEFKCLQLLEEGENEWSKDTTKKVSELDEEVARLEDEHNALTTAEPLSSTLQLDTLASILNEGNELLEQIREKSRKLKDEAATLKQELESLQQKEKAGSAQQQDTHITE